jgi:(R,R)-butanediol dehydrogenase/meso-butanediol dehydrogenase/diacetyl reductase
MKAAIIKEKGILSVEEIPDPQAGAGEVVIKVKYCGICGSDVRLFHDGFYPVGLIMGHEFCGRISEVGRGVEGWAVGDRVAVMPAVTCGGCYYCLHGQRHHCRNIKIVGVDKEMQGAFAEYVSVRANLLHRLPEQVTDEEAANIEPCAVSLRAVRQSGVMVGNSVVVFGAGSIGLFVIQCVQMAGAGSVYVVEPAQGRATAAAILGANVVFDSEEADIPGRVQQLTGEGADIAYVCTASPPAFQQAAQTVKRQGKVILVGGGGPAQVIPEFLMWKEVDVKGSYMYLDEFALVIELFKQRKLRCEDMISEVIPLERMPEALESLTKPTSEIKVLVQPG